MECYLIRTLGHQERVGGNKWGICHLSPQCLNGIFSSREIPKRLLYGGVFITPRVIG